MMGRASGLFGGGPWAIDPACDSTLHNTLYAARTPHGRRCICPRAISLLAENRKYRQTNRKEHRTTVGAPHRTPSPMPDLRAGLCQTERGARVLRASEDARLRPQDRDRAIAMCTVCPVFEPCRAWAIAQPAQLLSSGVVGGLTVGERRCRETR